MKASKLIQKLWEQIELHGDCEVRFDCKVVIEGYNRDYTSNRSDCISSVYFDNEKKEIHIN